MDKLCVNCKHWSLLHKYRDINGVHTKLPEIWERNECNVLSTYIAGEVEEEDWNIIWRELLGVETPCSFSCILWESREEEEKGGEYGLYQKVQP